MVGGGFCTTLVWPKDRATLFLDTASLDTELRLWPEFKLCA